MSYGFSMGFAQAKDLSEAMNLALEYVGMRMEPKRVTEELKRNIYYVPTIRARYACNKNVPYKCFELNGINSDIELFRCHALLKAILEKENPV